MYDINDAATQDITVSTLSAFLLCVLSVVYVHSQQCPYLSYYISVSYQHNT